MVSRHTHPAIFGSMKSNLLVSEGGRDWVALPVWMHWLLRVGAGLATKPRGPRSLVLISLPCESAASGLIAVGAVAGRMGVPAANDLAGHAQRMRERFNAGEKVRYCYRMPKSRDYRGDFFIAEWSPAGMVAFERCDAQNSHRNLTPEARLDLWHEKGRPALHVAEAGGGLQHSVLYGALLGDAASIREESLTQTESATCLAVHVQGEASTLTRFTNLRLKVGEDYASIAELTSVAEWNPARVSRLVLFNTRTDAIDRPMVAPRLLIVDGAAAFQRVADDPRFAEADVVCAFDLLAERDEMEKMSAWADDRRQWYSPMSRGLVEAEFGVAPVGITMHWFQATG